MKHYLSLIICFFVSTELFAQQPNNSLIQLSGVVVTEDAYELPYTTVYNASLKKGVISDGYGFFSIVCQSGDTLLFSRKGYKTSSFLVPDTLKDNRYSIIHMLNRDTLTMPDVRVYPWPNKEAFAQHFVNMSPYQDDIRRAQRELSGESLAFVSARLDADASLAHGALTKQQNTKIYTNGQLPQNNLLNPYAWSKLVEEWKAGNLGRQ